MKRVVLIVVISLITSFCSNAQVQVAADNVCILYDSNLPNSIEWVSIAILGIDYLFDIDNELSDGTIIKNDYMYISHVELTIFPSTNDSMKKVTLFDLNSGYYRDSLSATTSSKAIQMWYRYLPYIRAGIHSTYNQYRDISNDIGKLHTCVFRIYRKKMEQ